MQLTNAMMNVTKANKMMPSMMKKAINLIGDRLCGFDVCEVCPPADPTGSTPVLAARLIKEVMAVRAKHMA